MAENEGTPEVCVPGVPRLRRPYAMGWSVLHRLERVKAEARDRAVGVVRDEYAWQVACSTLVERLLSAIFLRGMGEKERAWRKGYVEGWCDAMRRPRKGDR